MTASAPRSPGPAPPPAPPAFSPHDLRHRRISLLRLGGVPWARIGEHVGQRNLAVTANTYTHVLTDESEIEYATLLAADESMSDAHERLERALASDVVDALCRAGRRAFAGLVVSGGLA